MRVEDLTKFEGECPIIVVFSTYMDIRIPLTKKWKKIINEKEDKPNTYHNNLIDYISGQIELSGFNMKSIGNLLIKKIVFNENNYYRYNNIEGFPITINDLGYWDKNRVRLNEDFHTVRLFNVLVRASNLGNWNLHLFARVREEEYKYECLGGLRYKECIPYQGNEHLLGTNKSK